jgi:hypothetical protein
VTGAKIKRRNGNARMGRKSTPKGRAPSPLPLLTLPRKETKKEKKRY